MYNLLIALGIATATFLLGTAVAGWIAGFIPATLALGIAYVLLARRTGNRLQAVMEKVTAALKKQRVGDAKALLESARSLGRWQFLVEAQVDAQVGALAYFEKDWTRARRYLAKAWSRNWQAQGMLAALDFREGKVDAALARLKKSEGPGRKEALFWGLWAYLLVEGGRRDEALAVLGKGLKQLPSSEPLKALHQSISNDRKVRMKVFGPGWYAFFPEHIPIQRVAAQAPRGRGFPQPRR
ncbi:MAG: hypothetical protein JXB39_02655 [Deltaproteobacteria bacterium]|nr:hypothetical protein [Deltaproteobacteria bacterium]